VNVFDLFGLPDVHDLADRVLSGDVSTVRTAASAARDAGVRLGAQADTLARERSSVALLWTGDVAVLADAKLRSAEDSVRKQARQVASGADDLYDAGDALDRAQREARRLDGLARALENRLDEALDRIRSIPLIGDFQAEALGLFTDFVAPLRPDSVALSIAMQRSSHIEVTAGRSTPPPGRTTPEPPTTSTTSEALSSCGRTRRMPTTVPRPQSELGPDGAGPLLNLPRDTAGVGADPGELDRWNREHHPEQTPGRPERELERRLPGLSIGDPWYNNPLPRVPYPSASPDGRLDVPHAPGAG
jgi:hypothetical protein